jgi:hypothetical protein
MTEAPAAPRKARGFVPAEGVALRAPDDGGLMPA